MRGSALDALVFLKRAFSRYYSRANIPEPRELRRREFGFFMFDGTVIRHKAFDSMDSLLYFMRRYVPASVHYSSAYYKRPDAGEMEKKGWLGSDLYFDLDMKPQGMECIRKHSSWSCSNCGARGFGYLELCPECGSKIEPKIFPCSRCIEFVRKKTKKLVDDILRGDFGFEDMRIYFSGRRGFHIHVLDESVRNLDSWARREIVRYVLAEGLRSKDLFLQEIELRKGRRSVRILSGPRPTDPGWMGRVAREAIALIDWALSNGIDLGIGKITRDVLDSIREGLWDFSKDADIFWEALFQRLDLGIEIDRQVTSDIHRLMRMPGTLHNKTGLRAIEIRDLDDCDPLTDAVAFSSRSIKVYVYQAPRFEIGGEIFGPYIEEKVELPEYAAILLMCMGEAVPDER